MPAPPRGLFGILAPQRPEGGPPRGLLAALSRDRVPQTGSSGLLDPQTYASQTGSRIDEMFLPGLERFTQRYVDQPLRSIATSTLGLPGDAYLAAAKLMAAPFGVRPEEVDRGFGYHVIPTSGDFDKIFPRMPAEFDAGPPKTPGGRIAQAGATGALSVPLTGGGSLLELLGSTAGSALPQAVSEKTDNPYAMLAAELLPFFIGSTKKSGEGLEEAAAKLGGATKAVRTLPGLGELGPSSFQAIRTDTATNPDALVYLNPNTDQLRSIINRDKWGPARYIQTPNGDVYAWPSGDSTHDEMMMRLGKDRTKYRGVYIIEDGELKFSRD